MSAKERDLGMSPRTLARLTGSTVPIRLGCYLASILVLHRLIEWMQAIAYGACLRSGEEAPDDDRQRELDDELRAKVVDELLKRRKEMVRDFDAYVKRIQQPFMWGGEPELLMASHVIK
ncbi:OTU domain-containing protein [Cucumis melo var. makuwa]|uniref:OTU domain-containing protein n=1 Tax=Cucumis melo var. makuwa TaxID=1194695 RepID=A0A5A7UDM2_CUCMM|nr:OTU domain-containing protein [Cucumis melo var. makuwa]TYK21446.1 OTU domain-containing protein [Cucumis melo var. makuwa]